MQSILQNLSQGNPTYISVFLCVLRYIAPAMAALLLWRCLKPLVVFKRTPEIWGWLDGEDGSHFTLTHWENTIGRSPSCDVVIDFQTISRNHAVLTRYDDGSWSIKDTDSNNKSSKNGVLVNGERIRMRALEPGDVINIGGLNMTLTPVTAKQEQLQAKLRAPASAVGNVANLLLLTVFQVLVCLAFLLTSKPEYLENIIFGFGGIMVVQWVLMIFYLCIRRSAFEMETVAFFLCTMGMAVIATVIPKDILKQLAALVLGVVLYLLVGWSLRDLERAKKCRYVATVLGLGFLVFTLLFGEEQNGAKAWIHIAGMNLQPSELSKVCFVYAGASTMDRLFDKRNLYLFIGYSILICGCLALMNDFGTALIFFVAFLIIAFMRSGSVGTVGLACTALGFAGVIAVKIAPYALRRFASWRNIWADPMGAGYQQTRALMCMAAGGLFGLGANQGKLKGYFAADSDIVFATITEEWGLILAVLLVVAIAALAVFAIRAATTGRSSFYTIGACTAAAILLTQAILNALGTLDVLPFTGVTFPFLSNGGSAMLGSWGLLAFLKAADTRQNASFAIRRVRKEGSA